MPKPAFRLSIPAFAALAVAAVASAQPTYTQPQPVRPGLPGPVGDELGPTALPPLVREGTFVSMARGRMVRGKSDRWFFIFDPDAAGRRLPPMVLLPNQHLGAMERLAERASASPSGDGGPGTRMFVTGQVTVYHNLNYFLPSAPPLVVRPDDPSASPATPTTVEPKPDPAAAPMPTQPAATGAEPSIDEIVSRLDKAASSIAASVPLRAGPATPSTAPATTTPSTSDADASRSGAAQPTLAAGVISHRRGRIARGADGALAFTFDSGTADAPAGPLLLVPSQTLMAIEALAERAGEAATYTVSGEVSVYRGRNHLLVRSYRINRPTDQIMPTQ